MVLTDMSNAPLRGKQTAPICQCARRLPQVLNHLVVTGAAEFEKFHNIQRIAVDADQACGFNCDVRAATDGAEKIAEIFTLFSVKISFRRGLIEEIREFGLRIVSSMSSLWHDRKARSPAEVLAHAALESDAVLTYDFMI